VADAVLAIADPMPAGSAPGAVQRKCDGCDEEKTIRTKSTPSPNRITGPDVGAAVSAAGQGGATLPGEMLAYFEPRFGHDFSGVRVHADADAADRARDVHARAYTIGKDIVFGSGEYAPSTSEGRRLLAHELAHTLQQAHTTPQRMIQRQPDQSGQSSSQPDQPSGTSPLRFKTFKVWVNAFIPADVPGVTIPRPNHSGESMVPGAGPPGWVIGAKTTDECYLGDSRDFDNEIHASSRMHSEVEVGHLDTAPAVDFQWHQCGTSHGIDSSTGNELESATAATSGMQFSNLRGNATVDPVAGVDIDPNPNLVQIDYDGAAAMPLLPSPDIDMNFVFKADPVGGTVAFDGMVDEFPAYEIYATADNGSPKTMLNLMPPPGNTPLNLIGDADRPVSGSASF